MSALTVLYALLFYLAAGTLVAGVAAKCWVYARTPMSSARTICSDRTAS